MSHLNEDILVQQTTADYLKDALKRFNPNLPETAYDEAIRQVVDYSHSQSMLSSNGEKISAE